MYDGWSGDGEQEEGRQQGCELFHEHRGRGVMSLPRKLVPLAKYDIPRFPIKNRNRLKRGRIWEIIPSSRYVSGILREQVPVAFGCSLGLLPGGD